MQFDLVKLSYSFLLRFDQWTAVNLVLHDLYSRVHVFYHDAFLFSDVVATRDSGDEVVEHLVVVCLAMLVNLKIAHEKLFKGWV